MIRVIGDSHALMFEDVEGFGARSLRGRTAYRLHRHHDKVIRALAGAEKQKVLFVFGEVDCRIHIYYKFMQQGDSVAMLVQRTCRAYTEYIQELRGNWNIYALNVLPTGEQRNYYKYPFYASVARRRDITLEMNKSLRFFCKLRKIPFVDIYSRLVDEDGYRRREYVKNSVHFTRPVVEFIREVIA